MSKRVQIVGVVAALLVGLAVPVALAQQDEGPAWWKCDDRGRCLFETGPEWGLPWLDEATVDQMNERAAELAAFLEDAGIGHDVLSLDVVTWDRSDPEANRAVAEFQGRALPRLPGEGFVPWPTPDRLPELFEEGRPLEFEGIWPDDLLPMLEEWLGEGFSLFEGMPCFGDDANGRKWGPFGVTPERPSDTDDPGDLFGGDDIPFGLDLEDLGTFLEEFFGGEGLGGLEEFFGGDGLGGLEEFFGGEGLGGLEEFFGGEGLLEGSLGEMFGPLAGSDPITWLDDTMADLAEHLESHGIDTVTIGGPVGVTWVVWDFFDETAAELVAEFFTDRPSDGDDDGRPDFEHGGARWETPEWAWPFDGGGL